MCVVFLSLDEKLIIFWLENNLQMPFRVLFSGLQTNWASCPLGSNSFRVTVNNTGSINFYSFTNVATFLPLQFPLASISEVSWQLEKDFQLDVFLFEEFDQVEGFYLLWKCNDWKCEFIEPIWDNFSNGCIVSIGSNWSISQTNSCWSDEKFKQ